MSRTGEEKFAEEFDLQLFRLIGSAEGATDKYGKQWGGTASALRVARVSVRAKMHPKDREEKPQ